MGFQKMCGCVWEKKGLTCYQSDCSLNCSVAAAAYTYVHTGLCIVCPVVVGVRELCGTCSSCCSDVDCGRAT